MPTKNITQSTQENQELFRLKVNGITILETEHFHHCIDQAWCLVHGWGMPASAIDILSLDPKSEVWVSMWEEVLDNAPCC